MIIFFSYVVMQTDDVGVVQTAQKHRLSSEALDHGFVVNEVSVEDLDRKRGLQLVMFCSVHCPKSTATDLLDNFVLVDDAISQRVFGIPHVVSAAIAKARVGWVDVLAVLTNVHQVATTP